jgi:outer membrane biosynthesis protein TonB
MDAGLMTAVLAISDEAMREMHGVANVIFLFLPAFLALIAGISLLVLTFRRELDAGKAASLAGLAGVIVVGLFAIEAMRHHGKMQAAAAPPPAAAAPALEGTPSTLALEQMLERTHMESEQLKMENEKLREAVHNLKAHLRAMEASSAAPASTPAPAVVTPRIGKVGGKPIQTVPPPAPPPAVEPPAKPAPAPAGSAPAPEAPAKPAEEAPKPPAEAPAPPPPPPPSEGHEGGAPKDGAGAEPQ